MAIRVLPLATLCSAASLSRFFSPPASHVTPMPKRFQPRGEFAVVLLGENLGRRHDGDLSVVLDRLQRRERRDDRLAAADVALQQPLHGIGLREIALDLDERLALCARERKRNRIEQAPA